jgi:hypothetical protein
MSKLQHHTWQHKLKKKLASLTSHHITIARTKVQVQIFKAQFLRKKLFACKKRLIIHLTLFLP